MIQDGIVAAVSVTLNLVSLSISIPGHDFLATRNSRMQGFLMSSRGVYLARQNVCFFMILIVTLLALMSCRLLVPECFICLPRRTFCAMFLSQGTCLIRSLLMECLLL